MVNVGNHHFETTIAITDSGKNQKWMLELAGERVMSNRVCTSSQSISLQNTY